MDGELIPAYKVRRSNTYADVKFSAIASHNAKYDNVKE